MRTFSARETPWLQELDGIELAPFWRRALAFLLDYVLVFVTFVLIVATITLGYMGIGKVTGHAVPVTNIQINPREMKFNAKDGTPLVRLGEEGAHILYYVIVPILYFGLFNWRTNGRSPGKFLFRIRIISIVHRQLTFWHSVERALGYGAAALEGGFGFVQFFIHPYRRCAQDRLAETIVVTERGYQAMLARTQQTTVTQPADPGLLPEPAFPVPEAQPLRTDN